MASSVDTKSHLSHCKVSLVELLAPFGFSVVASEAIQAHDRVLSLPKSMCLTGDDEDTASWPPVYAAATRLLLELHRGESGLLGSHVAVLRAVLKAGIDNVPSWSVAHERALRGTSIDGACKTMPVRRRFKEMVAPYMLAHSGLYPLGSVNEEAFVAAVSLIMSRSFTFHAGGDSSVVPSRTPVPMFVPLLDYFNHSSDNPDAVVSCDPSTGEVTARALRPVAKGAQMFISYGDLSDARLMFSYGFVIPPSGPGMESGDLENVHWNPHNDVTVRLEDMQAGARRMLCSMGLIELQLVKGRRVASASLSMFDRLNELLVDSGIYPAEGVRLTARDIAAFEGVARRTSAGKRKRGEVVTSSESAQLVPAALLIAVRAFLLMGYAHEKRANAQAEFDLFIASIESVCGTRDEIAAHASADKRHEADAFQGIQHILRSCIQRYPTGLEEDMGRISIDAEEDVDEEDDEDEGEGDEDDEDEGNEDSEEDQDGGNEDSSTAHLRADDGSMHEMTPSASAWLSLPPAGRRALTACRVVAAGEKALLYRYLAMAEQLEKSALQAASTFTSDTPVISTAAAVGCNKKMSNK